jgi:oligoendopeptidase F
LDSQQLYQLGVWRLSDILEAHSGPVFDSKLKELNSRLEGFESLRGRLESMDSSSLNEALGELESISEMLNRFRSYAYMYFSEDTRNQEASLLLSKMEDLSAEVENRTLFFRLWWTKLPEERVMQLQPENPDFRYYLSRIRLRRPHTLEEEVERAINLKNTTGVSGWVRLYEKLTSEFTYRVKVGGKLLRDDSGKVRSLTTSDIIQLTHSHDGRARKAAYDALLKKFGSYGGHLAEVYTNIVKDWWNENVRLRHFPRPISVRNLENDVPDRAVEALLSVCKKNSVVFQEFFREKAKMLGLKKMNRYHIYAPINSRQQRVEYSEALSTVFRSFSTFDEEFARLARRVFETGHVHSIVREGKVSGAYCADVSPKVIPYILLNYTGSVRDVYTIAHESGHAVHDQLASRHSPLTCSPPLVLAETASVFGEMLLFDDLMRTEKEGSGLKEVLEEKITEMYATIQRQVYFTIFEVTAHERIREGATPDEICKLYMDNLREQFGDSMEIPEVFKWEWSYIPHIFHTPFYCYSYSFGNLLTLALYSIYRDEGKSFVPGYMKILSYGGSERPEKILGDEGIDISSSSFWQKGFDVVSGMIQEMRRM